MNQIPNELTQNFDEVNTRKRLIEMYGDSNTMYTGENQDSEMVVLSIDREQGIVQKTYQENGWVRVNYFDKDGYATGETFEDKWK